MNTSKAQSETLRGHVLAICMSALVVSLVASAEDGKQFKTLLHDKNVYGSEDIAEGRYAQGIERLSRRAMNDSAPHQTRVPALIDLCAAYTVTRELDKAKEACDNAVDSGWYSGHAYNNRGTYNIAVGDYEAAIRDFQAAIDGRGADRIAQANLEFAQERLVAKRAEMDGVRVVARSLGSEDELAE